MHRRDALRLIGGTAGFVTVAACGAEPLSDSTSEPLPEPAPSASPVIRTLLGDIDPDAIDGVTLFHEHLSIKLSPAMDATDDVDFIVNEIRTAAGEGLGCIVDGGHPYMGRDLDACRRVASETDVHVVVSGGYYMERFIRPTSPQRARTRLPANWWPRRRATDWARSARSVRRRMSPR